MLGTYVLRDDLLLATPPPHPSEPQAFNNNPLATTTGPPTVGTKLSLAILAPRKPPTQSLFRTITSTSTRSAIPPSIQEDVAISSPISDAGSSRDVFHAPVFGADNQALLPVVGKEKDRDAGKRRKPKNNIIKSNSSFVSRVIPHEALQRRLNDRSPEGLLAFANINRAVTWLDLASEQKTENLTKILFTKAHALCHDVNAYTKSSTHLDIVMGFSTSDVIWYEPMSQKYARINKNGQINPSPISSIHWLPYSENLFLAAHTDGILVVYDKEKDDVIFSPDDYAAENATMNGYHQAPRLHVLKSVQSKNQKTNPVAVWKVSNQRINACAISPDGRHLAVVSEDGSLRIIDFLREQLVSLHSSYYGALLCCTFSPDGRYVLTGGQDDLVSIWSVGDSNGAERGLVARCQGHHSWVTDVKFDAWRCDERTYRFGSVGEDCRLLLWDFGVGMLGRPKAMSVRHRGSVASTLPNGRKESQATVTRLRSNSNLASGSEDGEELVHRVESRASTAVLPPVMSKAIDEHPLSWLGFEEECIITSCKEGGSFDIPAVDRRAHSVHGNARKMKTGAPYHSGLTFGAKQVTFARGTVRAKAVARRQGRRRRVQVVVVLISSM
ncbi:hypothetical protein LTR66_000446 [Elasticomyces elasticus]|nr:hypothetical protein LTR66_000446 [Elasticomyces elasticus]